MSKVYRITDLSISVEHSEIRRLLGYGSSPVPERVRESIRQIEDAAPDLLSPAATYRSMTNEEYGHSHYLCHIGELVVCLVTIGKKLEEMVQEFKKHGDLGRALILDSYGSAAAEATAEAAQTLIHDKMAKLGLRSSSRFSPGYSGWNVEEQKWILPALESESIGVTLTEGSMMVPRKSITFAVTIGDHPIDMRNPDICEYCGMVNCRFKHEADKHCGKPAD